jgi:hypothetical protein
MADSNINAFLLEGNRNIALLYEIIETFKKCRKDMIFFQ